MFGTAASNRSVREATPVAWRRAGQAAPLLSLLLATAGCGTSPPVIRVGDAALRERGPDATVVDITLTLRNENTAQIVLDEFEYTVTQGSEGARFVGRRRAGLTLAPLSAENVVLPAVLLPATAGAAPPDVEVKGVVGWRGASDLEKAFYDAGLHRPSTSFVGPSPVR